jgi:hypothetical protein
VLRRVAKWLTPDGVLVATIENDLGFDRLFRLQVRDRYDGDEAWHRGSLGFDDRPLYLREMRECLESAGLQPAVVYTGYPDLEDLSLLIEREAIGHPAVAATAPRSPRARRRRTSRRARRSPTRTT